jgi:hypothetical protein
MPRVGDHRRCGSYVSLSHKDSRRNRLNPAVQAIRRAPSLREQPVSARENSETVSIVYGHRRGIGTNFYVGATFARSRDPDAGLKHLQTEIFAKASWAFDVL